MFRALPNRDFSVVVDGGNLRFPEVVSAKNGVIKHLLQVVRVLMEQGSRHVDLDFSS